MTNTISIAVPKDLSNIKTKVAFGFTGFQIRVFACALGLGIPVFFLLKVPLGSQGALVVLMAILLPFFLIAVFEKEGIDAIGWLKILRRYRLRSPRRMWGSSL